MIASLIYLVIYLIVVGVVIWLLTLSPALASLACIRSQSDVATIKSPTHLGTTAFALWPEKSAGTSNLPVCRSYLQRQPFTTPVCMGL